MNAAAKAVATAPKQAASNARPRHRSHHPRAASETHEREADRLADTVVSGTDSAIAGRPSEPRGGFLGAATSFGSSTSPVSSPLARMSNSPGRPLDATTRGFMEGRFGHDFSKVRIHTGGAAAEAADAMQAHALASGTDIAFAPGMYRPGARAGMHLLAHELAHVVQQPRISAPSSVRLKKKPADKPFYQEALDRLELEKRASQVTLSTGGIIDMFGIVPIIEKFIELAEAIEAGDVKAVPLRLAEFVKMETNKLSSVFPSDPLANTIITRLLLLGLGTESQTFRRWFLKHEVETSSPSMRRKGFASEKYIWEDLLDQLTTQIPQKGGDPAVKVLDALLLLFGQLRDELAGLDQDAIKEDRKQRAEIAQFAGGLTFDHDVSISVYAAALLGLLKSCFAAIQTAYQVVLDQATADLAADKGTQFFDIAKDRLDNKLRNLIDPKEADKKSVNVAVEITRSEFKKGGGKHLDYFAKGKAAGKREVVIHFYDKEMSEFLANEMQLDFGRIFQIRREQITIIERIYGLAKDEKTGQLTAETQQNAAAIKKLGKTGLRLENDDDWRRFLLEKYETARANGATPGAALSSVVKLLASFLHAFTIHTPYNIDDFHDNYLSREFPRAMTGQLIHDCGVYALRNAYMLSLLREHKELQLRFRFIVLPVHVGLIITGNPGSDLPVFIAHNDSLLEYPAKFVAELRDAWIKTDEHGDPIPEPQAKSGGGATAPSKLSDKDEGQFLAEFAGAEFITGVDLPYKLLAVPKPTGGPNNIKSELWSAYTTKVAPTQLFGPETGNPKSPVYQFHLKYLKVLELMKNHHNQSLVPFWNNIAFEAWKVHEPKLTAALAKVNGATTDDARKEAKKAFDEAVQKYLETVQPGFSDVEAKFSPVVAAQVEIASELSQHPEALAKGTPVTHSARVDQILRTPWWSRDIYDHFSDLLKAVQVRAPFARKEDLLWPLD